MELFLTNRYIIDFDYHPVLQPLEGGILMKRLFTIIAVFMMLVIIQLPMFAETSSGHHHEEAEECACEVAESRDITIAEKELQTIDEELTAKISELEELTNMLYELISTKLSIEDFEMFSSELELRLSEVEQKLLNVESTIETGLPAVRDMIYEISLNLDSLEKRLTEYINVATAQSVEEVKTTVLDEVNTKLADIEVTLDIHDSDILKLYDLLGEVSEKLSLLEDTIKSLTEMKDATKSEVFDELSPILDDLQVALNIHDSDILKLYDITSTLTEEIAAIEESITNIPLLQESVETLSLRLDMHDQDIVNIYDALSTKANVSDIDELALKVENLENIITMQNSDIADRISLLEEYANMIYDTMSTKPSLEDVEQMIIPVKEEMDNISVSLKTVADKVSAQDVDIVKLYGYVTQLFNEVQKLSGRISLIETMVRELYQKEGK